MTIILNAILTECLKDIKNNAQSPYIFHDGVNNRRYNIRGFLPKGSLDTIGITNNTPCPGNTQLNNLVGTWRSLVERLLREQEVTSSNPVVPTIFFLNLVD